MALTLFASVAIVCTMSQCNNYYVDGPTANEKDSVKNTLAIQSELDYAMHTESAMNRFLEKYQIGETVFEIVSIDIESQPVLDSEIP